MQQRALGTTGLEVSVVGFGAYPAGGSWRYGWGSQDDRDSIAALRRAHELGVTWVDTAPIYGLGHSETVVGRALKGLAERPLVVTKCSQLAGPDGTFTSSLERASILIECEESLRRLDIEAIDVYLIHWPLPDDRIEAGWEALGELKDEGKARFIGVSNFDLSQLQRIEALRPVDVVELQYSLVRRAAGEDLIPYCAERGIGVVAYQALAAGLLTGAMSADRVAQLPPDDWRRGAAEFREPRLSRNLELAERLQALGASRDVPAGSLAIAWSLRPPGVSGTIVGFRTPAQVDELLPPLAEIDEGFDL
jgi:aryl-alcohol dehydrogenase-like predicted oxidoreductase